MKQYKKVLLLGMAVLFLAGCGASKKETNMTVLKEARPSVNGRLQVVGTALCDKDGNPVQLRGVSTHGITVFPEYVNQECFNQMSKEWGANIVRLAMYTEEDNGYCSGGDKEALKQLIRDGVDYAEKADMYVLVDWHILFDGDPHTNKEEAKLFWEQMSAELGGKEHVIFEICNEPNGDAVDWARVKSYAEEIIPVIRANAPETVICIGTPVWSQRVDEAAKDPVEGTNLMYSLHFYAATHKDSLRRTLEKAGDKGLPIFVTEFGVCDASGNGGLDLEQADKWMELLDGRGISYCIWNLSNKDESSAMIQKDCTKLSGFVTEEDLSESARWYLNHLKK